MKRWGIIGMVALLVACNPQYEAPDTALDAGRQFIKATYVGNFKRAGQLLDPAPEHAQWLEEVVEKDFRARDSFGKEALSNASIQIDKIDYVNDGLTFILYVNAYNGLHDTLRVLKKDNGWYIAAPGTVVP